MSFTDGSILTHALGESSVEQAALIPAASRMKGQGTIMFADNMMRVASHVANWVATMYFDDICDLEYSFVISTLWSPFGVF